MTRKQRKRREVDKIKKVNLESIKNSIISKYSNICEAVQFKHKSKPVSQEIELKHYKRPDMLFKMLLRAIRKYYWTRFTKSTQYHGNQRYRQTTFLLVTLEEFIREEFSENLKKS